MENELIVQLHNNFEDKAHTQDGVTYWYARDIQPLLEYARWENFDNLIKRAQNLILNGIECGSITECKKSVSIGSGTQRGIIDYSLDVSALNLVKQLAHSFKTNGFYHRRNETAIISMLKKHFLKRGIGFEEQKHIGVFKVDAFIGNSVILEFDEPHHHRSRQKEKDREKDLYLSSEGYVVSRATLDQDVIDIINMIEEKLTPEKTA